MEIEVGRTSQLAEGDALERRMSGDGVQRRSGAELQSRLPTRSCPFGGKAGRLVDVFATEI